VYYRGSTRESMNEAFRFFSPVFQPKNKEGGRKSQQQK
jgi:hypothetical protein